MSQKGMPSTLTSNATAARHAKVMTAARWCFLNFGFAKTSIEDIAKRAGLSRTLLYRSFKDKDAIYQAVFADWIITRLPAAMEAAERSGDTSARLLNVCRILALEPWVEMAGAAMAGEFLAACERIDPENEARFRQVKHDCVVAVLRDEESAEVFLLAFDGLFADGPAPAVLERRTRLLVSRFTSIDFDKDAS